MKKLLAIASDLLFANAAAAQTTTITFDSVDTVRLTALEPSRCCHSAEP